MAFLFEKHLRKLTQFSLIVLCMLVAGCASPGKLLEKATGAEESGQYYEAATYYVSVLEKESDWDDIRESLMRVGTIAIDNLLDEANELEDEGKYDDAIDTLSKLDDLKADARGVGVTLSVPNDYEEYKERLSQAAIDSLIRQGERAEDAGDWRDAIETYELVQKKYVLTVDQDEEMLIARGRVFIKWAEQDMEQGNHRAAFDRAAEAINVLGEDHPRAGNAIDLQDLAIEEGTRFVAFLPIWQTDDVSDEAPRGIIEEVDDLLQYDFWANPPLFIEQTDPVQLRREMRRLRLDNRLITRSEAANIGNVLDADYVVITQAVLFQFEERRMKEKTKKVETKGRNSLDTTYVEQSFTGRLNAEIEYRIVDMDSRKEVADGSVSADADAKMKRGVYEGDYQDLDLSRSERRLFDEEELDLAIRELEDEVIDDITPRLADEVFEAILKRIN